MSLIREVNPDTRQKGTLFSFATVYPDMRRYIHDLCIIVNMTCTSLCCYISLLLLFAVLGEGIG